MEESPRSLDVFAGACCFAQRATGTPGLLGLGRCGGDAFRLHRSCALRVPLANGLGGTSRKRGRIARCENTIPRPRAGPAGHSRRDFLRGSGLAAATAVLTGQATAALDEAKAAEDGPKVLSGDGRDHAQGQRPGSKTARSSRGARCSTPCATGSTSPAPSGSATAASCGACTDDRRRRSGLLLHHAGRLLPGQDDRDARELRHRRERRARTPSTRTTA